LKFILRQILQLKNRANIGGMIDNNAAAGMRSIKYGMTIDHLLSLDIALTSGEVLTLSALTEPELQAKYEL